MKRLLLNLLICGLAAGATGAPLEALVKVSGRNLAGVLLERGQGFVVFRPKGKPESVRIADGKLAAITFKTGENMDAIAEQFNDGAYSKAAEAYGQVLPAYLPYFGLPSNLSDEFPRWMISSYWAADYSLTIKLAELFKKVADDKLRTSAEFYSRLARMEEQGGYKEMSAFLNTKQAAALYPENSSVRLYIQARLLQHEEKFVEAIRTITLLIARHSQDADWMPRAELLCAELYFELEMPESGQAVLEDVNNFYSNEKIQEQAATLATKQKVDGEEK